MNKTTSDTRQPRGALVNAAWNAFGTLFGIVITFVMAPLLIRKLGADQWGLLLLVWSVTGVLGMANFGVGEATLRFIARHISDGDLIAVNRVLGATLTFYVSICTAISTAIFVLAPQFVGWIKLPQDVSSPVEWLLRLSALLFSFGMVGNAFRSIPMALHRYDITNRIGVMHTVLRSFGIIVLVIAGMDVVHIVIWEVVVAGLMLIVHAYVARRLAPGIRCSPSMSFTGLREIAGYSVFSFLTLIFLTIYREAGKLILGNRLGPASVAYLGTPDSVAYRLQMIVVSGIETLMPRFSANRDPQVTKNLLVNATWAAVACGVILYVPLAVLMPDFLRLWIDRDFAAQSAAVGQLLALGFIAPTAYAPIATLLRGTGSPQAVTVVMIAAGAITASVTLLLVSTFGPVAVGWAYVLSAIAWLGGLAAGWTRVLGRQSSKLLSRVLVLPLVVGCVLGAGEALARQWWGELGWIGLFVAGSAFATVNAVALIAVDRMLGGDSSATFLLRRVLSSDRIPAPFRQLFVVSVR